jgi:DNA-binding PadR family transcriptional regulator
MALRNAILAALLEGEASGYDLGFDLHGYDLAKSFDASVANFWTATPQQLDRELEKMEAQGLVSARVGEQQRRPNKRLFSLTEAGRAALHDYTTRRPKPIVIRDELLVQVQSLDAGDPKSIREAVQDRQKAADRKLKRYERLRDRLLLGRTEAEFLTDAERVGPYLTLARGIAFEQETLRWCEFVLDALSRRADRR